MMKFKWGKLKKKKSRTDVWYTGRFTNGFTKFEASWKRRFYHLEEDGYGSYSVSNFTTSWNPEIAGSLAVFTLSVLFFSVIWHLSLIFQLVFLTYVFLILFMVNKWENLAKFYFVAWRYLAIIHSSSFEQFLESTTMFLMKKCFAFWWKKCGNSWLSYGGRGSRHECKTKIILRWRWCYCVIFCPLTLNNSLPVSRQ